MSILRKWISLLYSDLAVDDLWGGGGHACIPQNPHISDPAQKVERLRKSPAGGTRFVHKFTIWKIGGGFEFTGAKLEARRRVEISKLASGVSDAAMTFVPTPLSTKFLITLPTVVELLGRVERRRSASHRL